MCLYKSQYFKILSWSTVRKVLLNGDQFMSFHFYNILKKSILSKNKMTDNPVID